MVTLTARHMRMAKATARRFHRRLPSNVALEDMEQAALIGLVDALTKHPEATEGQSHSYTWYLHVRMRGEMLDELRRQDWQQRRRGRVLPRIVHLEDVRDGAGRPIDFADSSPSPEYWAGVRIDAERAWRAPMDPVDRRVLLARFKGGMLQRDIAASEGVSEPRISQRTERGLDDMRWALTRTGGHDERREAEDGRSDLPGRLGLDGVDEALGEGVSSHPLGRALGQVLPRR